MNHWHRMKIMYANLTQCFKPEEYTIFTCNEQEVSSINTTPNRRHISIFYFFKSFPRMLHKRWKNKYQARQDICLDIVTVARSLSSFLHRENFSSPSRITIRSITGQPNAFDRFASTLTLASPRTSISCLRGKELRGNN